jgi:acyl-CoA reductase-like NAD-dependent aldehyde dehydrogenase
MSALIHPAHAERVMGFIDRARAAGDTIARGGNRRGATNFIEPTLIVPKSNDSEVVQHEVFGPVLTFQTFTGEAEGIALANSTAYGLSGIVYTGDAARAERVGRAVRGGTVWVNTFRVARAATMRSISTPTSRRCRSSRDRSAESDQVLPPQRRPCFP